MCQGTRRGWGEMEFGEPCECPRVVSELTATSECMTNL